MPEWVAVLTQHPLGVAAVLGMVIAYLFRAYVAQRDKFDVEMQKLHDARLVREAEIQRMSDARIERLAEIAEGQAAAGERLASGAERIEALLRDRR